MDNEANTKAYLVYGAGEKYGRPKIFWLKEDEPPRVKKTLLDFMRNREGKITPYLLIPASQAREFLETAERMAGLSAVCCDEDVAAQDEFIAKCQALIKTLPEEAEGDG